MKKELQDKLYTDYPNLYKQKDLDMSQTAMCWGFCCGDGWYKIIDKLSKKLEPLGIEAAQVKEKFGSLRYYVDKANEKAMKLIFQAEKESSKTCENCGEPGILRGKQWLKTLCDNCYTSWKKD